VPLFLLTDLQLSLIPSLHPDSSLRPAPSSKLVGENFWLIMKKISKNHALDFHFLYYNFFFKLNALPHNAGHLIGYFSEIISTKKSVLMGFRQGPLKRCVCNPYWTKHHPAKDHSLEGTSTY
jgi:hypothetical protein